MKTAKDEGYGEITASDILKLKADLNEAKQNDLTKYRKVILEILESEIAARYYGEKGREEAAMKDDPEIREAFRIIHTPAEYRKILNH